MNDNQKVSHSETRSAACLKCLRAHIARWKDSYHVLVVFLALLASAVAILYTHSSVRLQHKTFLLHNRPYLVLTNPRFGAVATDSQGIPLPENVVFDIINVSDIPAVEVKAKCKAWLEADDAYFTEMTSAVSVKGEFKQLTCALRPGMREHAESSKRILRIEATVGYRGILATEDLYGYRTVIRYYPLEKVFRYERSEID